MPRWKKSQASERSQEVLRMRGPEPDGSRTCGDSLNLDFSSSKKKPYDRRRKVTEKRAGETNPELCMNVGQKSLTPLFVEEPVCQRETEQESPQTGGGKTSLKARHIKRTPSERSQEVLRMTGPEPEGSRTCGDSLNLDFSSSKKKPYDRRRKVTEKRAGETNPELCMNVGQKSLTPLFVEEPVCKRETEQESPQTGGGKTSLKARHIKHTRKARVDKFYKKGKLLGQGGFGSVYAGIRKSDGLVVALKYVRKYEDEEIELPGLEGPLPREVGLIKTVNKPLSHPNILELYDWFDRPASYVMAMERPYPCQDLFTYCQEQGGVLNEGQARNVTRQLLGALQHCHDRGVVHRDVKPENILIQTETQEIKLIDFGCGDPLQDTPYREFAGTKCYQPLEWFQEKKFLAGPGTVWSVGVTLYEMVCGDLPFTVFSSERMQQAQFPEGLSPGIRDFIGCCLRPNAEDRSTLDQLQLHPWLCQAC